MGRLGKLEERCSAISDIQKPGLFVNKYLPVAFGISNALTILIFNH